MANRVKINPAALGQIVKSAEVGADLDRRARNVATAAGPGFTALGGIESRRERATVITSTRQARVRQAREGTLQRSLDAARD